MIKSAGIYKFKTGKTIVHSEKNVIDSASYASAPYFIEENPSYKEIVVKLIEALEQSLYDAPEPLDWKALQKKQLKTMGFKTMKDLHDGSLYVSVYIKDGNYNIAPSINKGSRLGFHYTKDKMIIPEKSSIEELVEALKEAFEKCS